MTARTTIGRGLEAVVRAARDAEFFKTVRHYRNRSWNPHEGNACIVRFVEQEDGETLTVQEDVTEFRVDLMYVVEVADEDDDSLPEVPFEGDERVLATLAQDRTLNGAANDIRIGGLSADDDTEASPDRFTLTRTIFVQVITLAENPTVRPE